MSFIQKLKSLDQSMLCDNTKQKIKSTLNQFSGTPIPAEENAAQKVYELALKEIDAAEKRAEQEEQNRQKAEKARLEKIESDAEERIRLKFENEQKAKKAEDDRIAAEKQKEEDDRVAKEKLKAASTEVEWPHTAAFAKHPAPIPTQLKLKRQGTELLIGKFKKDPLNEKKKKSAMDSSQLLADFVMAAIAKITPKPNPTPPPANNVVADRLAAQKKAEEERNRLAAEKKTKAEEDRLAAEKLKEEQDAELTRIAAEREKQETEVRIAKEKLEQEEKSRGGAFGNPALKGIFGV